MNENFEFVLPVYCKDDKVIEIATVLLKHVMENKTTIEYGELANLLSFPINPRNLDHPLGCISDACKDNGIPPLSVMVVNKEEGMPGSGFFKYFYPGIKKNQWDKVFVNELNRVAAFDKWDKVLEAFCGEA